MSSIIRIFNHFAQPLDQLADIPTTPRSWVLNGYGRCEFSIAPADPKCTERNFQFGNLVHIEHVPSVNDDNTINGKLASWTGIILPPRKWDVDTLHVTAYSAEAILAYRAMPYVTVSGSPADVFREIIGYANQHPAVTATPGIVFRLGRVDNLQTTFSDDLKTNAYDHIGKLCKFTGMDWDAVGSIDNRSERLVITVNLYARKVASTPLILGTDNTELQAPLLTEQGTPTNQIFAYTHAYTEADRQMQVMTYQGSYDDYGPIQINTVYVGQHDLASVEQAARSRLDTRGRPAKLFKRVALDVGDTLSHIGVGNVVQVHEPRVGFNQDGTLGFRAAVRIISVDYNDLSNKAPLNVEVI
jgi:hypothetical protein